ncbi:MAG: hypothetical protein ACQ9MH_01800 [Nitrospinales bacterium]
MKQSFESEENNEVNPVENFLKFVKTTRPELEIDGGFPDGNDDFVIKSAKSSITVQLTELVERDFVLKKASDKLNRRADREYIHSSFGHMPWVIDNDLRDSALARAIETKVKNNYAKGEKEILWLVIFSTTSFLQAESIEEGQRIASQALLSARDYIAAAQDFIFDEVWFINPESEPVMISRHEAK